MQQPATNNQWPITDNQRPTPNNQETPNNKQQTTSNQQQNTQHIRTTNYLNPTISNNSNSTKKVHICKTPSFETKNFNIQKLAKCRRETLWSWTLHLASGLLLSYSNLGHVYNELKMRTTWCCMVMRKEWSHKVVIPRAGSRSSTCNWCLRICYMTCSHFESLTLTIEHAPTRKTKPQGPTRWISSLSKHHFAILVAMVVRRRWLSSTHCNE